MRTIEQYNKKRKKSSVFRGFTDLYNFIILPMVRRVNPNTLAQELVNAQPMDAPMGILGHFTTPEYGVINNKETFPFWRIKVIFKP